MAFKLEYICGRNYNPLPEEKDIKFMQRCIELASNAKAHVHPNPMVGCVIVCDNKIIGEGYHKNYGNAHAEVKAIASVQDKNKLTLSTLYVNLEPCAHHGKTPPCTDLIIQHKIPHVVISNVDPHEKVAGKGIQKLIDAGVTVTKNVCTEEGASLNRSFFTYHKEKRPYIILKWAETADGFIGLTSETTNQKNAISNDLANRYVHQLRAESGAIFVGTNTAIVDNPSLTTR
ncbi:MAG: diaminohydroxyphosphoribosylaminopyrimidine deaminase, partial [Bacteroidia bacterium]